MLRKCFWLRISLLIMIDDNLFPSWFGNHKNEGKIKSFVRLTDANTIRNGDLSDSDITIGDILTLRLGNIQESIKAASSREEKNNLSSKQVFVPHEEKQESEKENIGLLEPESESVVEELNVDQNSYENEKHAFETMEEKLPDSDFQQDNDQIDDGMKKIKSFKDKAHGRLTRKRPIRFKVKANNRCNPKYSTKRACMRAASKGEHSDQCNCFEGNKFCNVLTNECEKISSRGERRNLRKPKSFQGSCDGDYQCEETLRCKPREYRTTWETPRAWCITEGKELDTCGVTLRGDGRKIKHHEQCRKGFYCSEVSRGRKLQGACRKQQKVGEKCMNDYHCQEGHLCLKKNNGREKDKVCGKIAAYPKENCHPDIYQCVGKHMCLKPQIVKDQLPNAKNRQIRPGRGTNDERNPKISSNRRRPCLRFRGFPKILRRCRIRNGLVRQKRETTENNYGRSILHIQKNEEEKEFKRSKRQVNSYESEDRDLESEPFDEIRKRRRSRKPRRQRNRQKELKKVSVETNEIREKFTRRNKEQTSRKKNVPIEKIYQLNGKFKCISRTSSEIKMSGEDCSGVAANKYAHNQCPCGERCDFTDKNCKPAYCLTSSQCHQRYNMPNTYMCISGLCRISQRLYRGMLRRVPNRPIQRRRRSTTTSTVSPSG